MPSLSGFQQAFSISSGMNFKQISDYVSFVYIGCGFGAAASFFINDRIGRLWSFRLYSWVWVIRQMLLPGAAAALVLFTPLTSCQALKLAP